MSLFVFYLAFQAKIPALEAISATSLRFKYTRTVNNEIKIYNLNVILEILFAAVIVCFIALALVLTAEAAKQSSEGVSYVYLVFSVIWASDFLKYTKISDKINEIDNVAISMLIKQTLLAIIGIGWFVFPSWITYDLTFIAGAVASVTVIGRLISLRFLFIFLSMLVLYDIWGVFISGLIVEVAFNTDRPLPFVFTVPSDPTNLHFHFLSGLGMGDVLIGGIATLATKKVGLHYYAIAGYLLGLFLALVCSKIFDTPMPALVTIVPATFILLAIGKAINKPNNSEAILATN